MVSEQFMEHIEYTFHAFCKVVLRNEAMSAYRELGRKLKRESSLDYLMSHTSFKIADTSKLLDTQLIIAVTQF